MMIAVLAVLCLYLAVCYAYGGYLLLGVFRRKSPAAARVVSRPEEPRGPRAGILRVADTPGEAPAAEPASSRTAA